MSIAVSIVSFNTKDFLRNCLSNLKSSENLSVWVLDNTSSDGSAQMVEKEFPKVHLIKSPDNLGFAKGQNQILKRINEKYVLLLNPDTEFNTRDISKMADFMEQNPECSVLSCKLTDFAGHLESNGGNDPFGLALLSWLFNLEFLGKMPNFHQTDAGYYQTPHEVDWVAGTFMMIRTEVFKKAGFLSEDFFMYFEDVEFCYRVKKSGGTIMINPKIAVKHKSGSSSKDPRFSQWRGEFKGLIKFYSLHFGLLAGFIVRLLAYSAIFLRIIAFSLTGQFKKTTTYAKVMVNI